jgi:REP element-mobilizing transposase RayT
VNHREQIWGVQPAKPVRRARAGKRRTPAARRVTSASRMLGSSVEPAKGEQLSFAHKKTWGGPRVNSGRKAALRPNVRHRTRPSHEAESPVLVTMRRAKGLPSLRSDRLHRLLREAIRSTRREGFRIVHYSVQADHVHLVVEADDPIALTSGMRSFSVRVAMRVNRRVLLRTRGHVWGDRHHRRELTTPSEVRNVLVYVHNNPPSTWLLETGWSTVGLGYLNVGEVPRATRA